MCGIFGSVGAPLGPESIARVLATLRHRGPESNDVVRLQEATLAHTRLRIIDLSPAGAQPMANEDDTVWVTFNGEIYNFQELRRELAGLGHRFRSQSDTETLVHGYEQWGDALVDRLDGMFAFGIWDTRARRLLLARDRAGKKPLFYAQHGGRFLFASEMKALFAAGVPLEIEPAGVVGYLAYGYAPPPGHALPGGERAPAGAPPGARARPRAADRALLELRLPPARAAARRGRSGCAHPAAHDRGRAQADGSGRSGGRVPLGGTGLDDRGRADGAARTARSAPSPSASKATRATTRRSSPASPPAVTRPTTPSSTSAPPTSTSSRS